jgi:hypothetical protein
MERLTLLDTITGDATDYCLSTGSTMSMTWGSGLYQYTNSFQESNGLIWSPDGEFIIVNPQSLTSGNNNLLIDLEGGFAASIGFFGNEYPVAMLNSD